MKKSQTLVAATLAVVLTGFGIFLSTTEIVSAANSDLEVVGPKGAQYLDSNNISFEWNPSSTEIGIIEIQDESGDLVWTVHSEKGRGDQSITTGEYNMKDIYQQDWVYKTYLDDEETYRFVLKGVDVEAYSDWFVFYYEGDADEVNLNLDIDNVLQEGGEMIITFDDINADYYLISANCSDNTTVSGKVRPDICTDEEKVFSGSKDTLTVDEFYPETTADVDVSFSVKVVAYDNGKAIAAEVQEVTLNKDYNPGEQEDPGHNEDPEVTEAKQETKESLDNNQTLVIIANVFGKDSEIYKIIEILIGLGLIK